jgi:hypothetical protein
MYRVTGPRLLLLLLLLLLAPVASWRLQWWLELHCQCLLALGRAWCWLC